MSGDELRTELVEFSSAVDVSVVAVAITDDP